MALGRFSKPSSWLAGCRSAADVRFSGTSTSKKAENAVDVRFFRTSTALEGVGAEPSLVVPKIAGFSEQTYKFGAFVPVFDVFSEQIFILIKSTALFSARSAE